MLSKLTETQITKSIRDLLSVLRIPHWKTWGGFIGQRGIPEIIGVIPGSGRFLAIEVKRPGGKLSYEQLCFLQKYENAGAVCMVAYDQHMVLARLQTVGYEPAKKVE